MRNNNRLLAAIGLLVLVTACNPQDPDGQEPTAPALEPPAATAGSTQNTAEEPAAIAPEPLALRFASPNIGPAAGGNDITIDGQGFSAYPRIAIGGVQAWIRSVTPTEIRVTVPAPEESVAVGETLVVDVVVTNPPEGSQGPVSQTLTRSYSYVGATAGSPTAEPPAADDTPEQPPKTDTDTTESTPSAEPAASPQPALVASFQFTVLPNTEDCPAPNTNMRFTDRSTGGASEWWWEFGDGNTSKEQHQEHCYTVPGMRSVTLTVSNADELASTSKIVTAGME